MMLEIFVPDLYIRDYRDLNLEELKGKGIKALVIDIDNTLVPFDVAAPDADAAAFLQAVLDSGIKPVIISNNHELRVRSFAEGVGADYVFDAGKPGIGGYTKAMLATGSVPETTMMVGDQLFTDIWGANRSGVYSVLVKQIGPDPYFHIRLKRIAEAVVKPFYRLYSRRHSEDKYLILS